MGIQGFLLFMVANGSILFAYGWVRWFSLGSLVLLAGILFWKGKGGGEDAG